MVTLTTDYSPAYNGLCNCYLRLGKYAEAAESVNLMYEIVKEGVIRKDLKVRLTKRMSKKFELRHYQMVKIKQDQAYLDAIMYRKALCYKLTEQYDEADQIYLQHKY